MSQSAPFFSRAALAAAIFSSSARRVPSADAQAGRPLAGFDAELVKHIRTVAHGSTITTLFSEDGLFRNPPGRRLPARKSFDAGIQTPTGETAFPWTAEQIRQRLGISLTVYHFNKLQLLALPGPMFKLLDDIRERESATWTSRTSATKSFTLPISFIRTSVGETLKERACHEVGLSVCSFHSGMNRLGRRARHRQGQAGNRLAGGIGGPAWLTHLSTPGGDDLYGAANRTGRKQLARREPGTGTKLARSLF